MTTRFDASFQHRTGISNCYWMNHNKLWLDGEEGYLGEMFDDGKSLGTMCYELQRSPGGVIAKLKKMGLLTWQGGGVGYVRTGKTYRRSNREFLARLIPMPGPLHPLPG